MKIQKSVLNCTKARFPSSVKGGRFKICCFGFVSSNLTTGNKWRHRLMVRTLVFETSNPGSIPGDASWSIPVSPSG